MDAQSDFDARAVRVVRTYEASLLRLAYAYVRNAQDAEDIAQEVFLAFFKAAPAFTSAEHEKAYLLRATINRCKNHFKSGWFKNRRPLPEALPDEATAEGQLLPYVLALEEKYRLPLHLHYYEGYSIKEIAQILNEKPATIGTRLARGRDALRAEIGGIEYV